MFSVKGLTLILGNGGLASPLWSLRFEILFSLALPVYIWAAIKRKKMLFAKLTGCIAIITIGGSLNNTTLLYVPMFMIGVLLLNARWFVLLADPPEAVLGSSAVVTLVGAAIIIFVCIGWSAARHFLENRVIQRLGLISFSLYLVHEPIVVACGYLFGPGKIPLAIGTAILVSMLLAPLFYRVVERPSHALAKRIRQSTTPKPQVPAGAVR